jgi:hypothetical protein
MTTAGNLLDYPPLFVQKPIGFGYVDNENFIHNYPPFSLKIL